jgi:hypothetical protein
MGQNVSDLDAELNRGEITLDEYHERWIAEMEENERLHLGIHDRFFDKLMELYPGEGVDADEFLASE